MLDTLGPFTNTLEDMGLAMEVALGAPVAPMAAGRVARLDGWFVDHAIGEFDAAFATIAGVLGDLPMAHLPRVEAARAAAFSSPAMTVGASIVRNWRGVLWPLTRKRVTGCWRVIWCPRPCATGRRNWAHGSGRRLWRCSMSMMC
jgi:hypothetical protein